METVTVDRAGGVATVTFRRPARLNALNAGMMAELTAAFGALSAEPGIGAIIVTGEGRGFMAGADIADYAAQTPAGFDAFQAAGERMYSAIETCPRPVIAAVNGVAAGGGFELVLCCDLVIAADTARLGLPEVTLGLVPGGGGTQRSVRRLGPGRAAQLLLTGALLPAGDFLASGFVAEVTPPEALMQRAAAVAAGIAAAPAAAVEGLKRLMRMAAVTELADGLAAERALVQALYRTDAARARIRAFAERSAARAAARAGPG